VIEIFEDREIAIKTQTVEKNYTLCWIAKSGLLQLASILVPGRKKSQHNVLNDG
jgi:hypothetical protein